MSFFPVRGLLGLKRSFGFSSLAAENLSALETKRIRLGKEKSWRLLIFL
jgi:hypothetical protein